VTFYEKKVQVYHIDLQRQIESSLDLTGGKEIENPSSFDLDRPKKKSGLALPKNGRYVVVFHQNEINILDFEANKVILTCQPFPSPGNCKH